MRPKLHTNLLLCQKKMRVIYDNWSLWKYCYWSLWAEEQVYLSAYCFTFICYLPGIFRRKTIMVVAVAQNYIHQGFFIINFYFIFIFFWIFIVFWCFTKKENKTNSYNIKCTSNRIRVCTKVEKGRKKVSLKSNEESYF